MEKHARHSLRFARIAANGYDLVHEHAEVGGKREVRAVGDVSGRGALSLEWLLKDTTHAGRLACRSPRLPFCSLLS
jgi:hypothetical protein